MGGGSDEPPLTVVGGIAHQTEAMLLALGVAAAIVARDRQGVGQHVDSSQLGSQLAL